MYPYLQYSQLLGRVPYECLDLQKLESGCLCSYETMQIHSFIQKCLGS